MPDARLLGLLLALLASFGAPSVASAVDPVAVDKAARQAGLERVAQRAGAAARGGVAIRRRPGAAPVQARGTTRLGGSPDLPPSQPWPRCARRPMAFLGQVRAEDLPPGSGLPAAGLLAFFTQVSEDPGAPGTFLWAGDCSAALYVAPGRALQRRAAPRQRPRLVLRPATVTLAAGPSLPDLEASGRLGAPLDAVRLGPDEAARYGALRARLAPDARPAHRMLGYPDVAELDPRAQCAARAGTPAEWQLILQFDADPALGFDVADAGRLSILARAGRLDRVCSVFDSA